MPSETPERRRRLLVSQLVESRRSNEPVVFEASGRSIEYDDRVIRLELDADERNRLETLRSTYHVFKIKQPETMKADGGVVYLSAVTDAKHAADFVDSLFREVYGLGDEFELRTSEAT